MKGISRQRSFQYKRKFECSMQKKILSTQLLFMNTTLSFKRTNKDCHDRKNWDKLSAKIKFRNQVQSIISKLVVHQTLHNRQKKHPTQADLVPV